MDVNQGDASCESSNSLLVQQLLLAIRLSYLLGTSSSCGEHSELGWRILSELDGLNL